MTVSPRLPVKVVLVDGSEAEIDLETNLQAIADGIGAADDDPGEPTVIGLLQQVVAKLDEVKTAIENLGGGGEGGE